MCLKFIRTAAKGAVQYKHIVDHYYCRLMTRYGNAALREGKEFQTTYFKLFYIKVQLCTLIHLH